MMSTIATALHVVTAVLAVVILTGIPAYMATGRPPPGTFMVLFGFLAACIAANIIIFL